MSDLPAEHHPRHIASQRETGVLVGWTHADLGSNIELRLQSARSRFALENGEHETHSVLMTNNQALLLAKFLLDATQQTMPKRVKPSLWQKVAASLR